MKHVAFWCGEPIDSLSREQRDEIRAHIEKHRIFRGTCFAPFHDFDEHDAVLRRLDELDYFDATQFTLLGAADDRLRQ